MATFLVTPYGYAYDMPMVTAALLLVAMARPLDRAEPMLFGLVAVVPLLMVSQPLPLVEPALLAAAGLLLTARLTRLPANAIPRHP